MLRRLLLLPLLSPLLAATVLGALNPTPVLSLRLLTWTSPALPLGAWISAAALGGAALSGAGTSLALRPPVAALRRRVRLERSAPGWDATPPEQGGNRRHSPSPGRAARGRGADPTETYGRGSGASEFAATPTPAPGEPLPTMTVPFRVIRRADGARPHAAPVEVAGPGPWWRSPGANPQAAAQQEDWDSPTDEDW